MNDWTGYTLTQLERLMDSVGANSLERKDLTQIIDELLLRCRSLERVVDRF